MKRQTLKSLIREEIAFLLEASLSKKTQTLLQPVLDAVSSGEIKSSEISQIIAQLNDLKVSVSPGGGKFSITNYKNGVVVKKNNSTKTITLTSKDSSIEPKTFKYNSRYNRYINPNDGTEETSGINDIVKKYAAGEYNTK